MKLSGKLRSWMQDRIEYRTNAYGGERWKSLVDEAERMEKALEFYADKRNSTPGHRVAPGFLAECIPSAICMERGQRAHEALGKANATDV